MPRTDFVLRAPHSPVSEPHNMQVRTRELTDYNTTGRPRSNYVVINQQTLVALRPEEALAYAREIHAHASTIIAEEQQNG